MSGTQMDNLVDVVRIEGAKSIGYCPTRAEPA